MHTFSNIIFILFATILFYSNLFSGSKDPVRGKNGMVVSASELASQVGIDILKKGGNAIDAAVAVGFALAVTYPGAGNIGGGGFMVIHLSDGTNTSIDYREKAPLTATEFLYQDSLGNFLPEKSQFGVTSSGVPGSVAGLIYALKKYGSLSLTEVIQPAIDLARNGFILEFRLAKSFENEIEYFNKDKKSKAPNDYFVTQVVKANKNGVFTYVVPRAGWWGFAGLNTSNKKIKFNGEEKDVEIGAVLWIEFKEMK